MFIVERWVEFLFRFVRIKRLKYLIFTPLAASIVAITSAAAVPAKPNSLISIQFKEGDFPPELRGLVKQIRMASETTADDERSRKFAAAVDEARRIDGRVDRAVTDRVWFLRGYAEYNSGKSKDALSSFSQSLKLRPDNALSIFYEGLALKDLNRCKEALPKFQEVVWLVPSMKADPIYFTAYCQEKTGKTDEAKKNYLLAIDAGSTYEPALKKYIEIKSSEMENTANPKVREQLQRDINRVKGDIKH